MTGALADADADALLGELKSACDQLVEDDKPSRLAGKRPELTRLAAAVRNVGDVSLMAGMVEGPNGIKREIAFGVWDIAASAAQDTAWAAAGPMVDWRNDGADRTVFAKVRRERINALTISKFLVVCYPR